MTSDKNLKRLIQNLKYYIYLLFMLSIKLIHHSIKDFEVIYKRLFG